MVLYQGPFCLASSRKSPAGVLPSSGSLLATLRIIEMVPVEVYRELHGHQGLVSVLVNS